MIKFLKKINDHKNIHFNAKQIFRTNIITFIIIFNTYFSYLLIN